MASVSIMMHCSTGMDMDVFHLSHSYGISSDILCIVHSCGMVNFAPDYVWYWWESRSEWLLFPS